MVMKNKRKYFRVKCKEPPCARISIVKVNNKQVNTKTGIICLEDISAGGLKFLSALNMPANDVMVIQFRLVIGDEITTFCGNIIRKEELEDHIFRYGVKFINDSSENEQQIRKLYEVNKKKNINESINPCWDVNKSIKKYKCKKIISMDKRYKVIDKIAMEMYQGTNNEKILNLKWENILVNNISLERIEFISGFELPVINDKIVEFKITTSDREILVKGYVVRSEESNEGIYNNVIKFCLPDYKKKIIAEVLNLKNQLRISFRNSIDKRMCFSGKYNNHQPIDKKFEDWA